MPEPIDSHGRLLRGLAECGCDALVCALPQNVLLLSGYWPVTGTSVAIATADRTVVLAPGDERRFWSGSRAEVIVYSRGSLELLLGAGAALEPALTETLQSMGLAAARLGLELSPATQPAPYASMVVWNEEIARQIRQAFPRGEILDAMPALGRMRSVLTAEEAGTVKRACEAAGRAFEPGRASLAEGLSEREAAQLFGTGFGTVDAARAGGFAYAMSGPNSARAFGAFAHSSSRQLEPGDFVLVHANSWLDGFWTDLTRTYTVGPPDVQQRKIQEAILEAREAGLAAIRPGVRAAKVDAAVRSVLARRGFGAGFKHSSGHGVGFAAIDHNAIPRLHPASPDVLEPGMVFNLEPAVYIEGSGGARHCDVAAVTNTGVEVFSPFHSRIDDLTAG
jgi:Xaa-Pro aminopeptidase